MSTVICISHSFTGAKHMVQNCTTSKFAADDNEYVGLHGDSIEGANLAVINRRKALTAWERETYRLLVPHYSQILDNVWSGPPAVLAI